MVVVAVIEGALVAGFLGVLDGQHEGVLGVLNFFFRALGKEFHAGVQAFIDKRPDRAVGAIRLHAELVAPAANVVIHRPVQLALGALGLVELFLQDIENLVLETILPFLARVLGSEGVFLQLVGFKLLATGFVACIFVILRIEGFCGFGMFFGEGVALDVALAAGHVGIVLAGPGDGLDRFEALLPFRKLRGHRGDHIGNLRIGHTGQGFAALLSPDEMFALL